MFRVDHSDECHSFAAWLLEFQRLYDLMRLTYEGLPLRVDHTGVVEMYRDRLTAFNAVQAFAGRMWAAKRA